GVGQRGPPSLDAAAEQHRGGAGGHADAGGGDRGRDQVHGVVDRQAGVDDPAGAVNVELDLLVGVLLGEVEELGDDQVGDLVVNRGAEKDDAVAEQQRVDVVGALA